MNDELKFGIVDVLSGEIEKVVPSLLPSFWASLASIVPASTLLMTISRVKIITIRNTVYLWRGPSPVSIFNSKVSNYMQRYYPLLAAVIDHRRLYF